MLGFYQIALDYSHNPVSFLAFLIALGISLILTVTLAISVVLFVMAQFTNIYSLYTSPKQEDLSNFHPYTQSILGNYCPEFRRIQQLKAMPQTAYIRNELRQTVQSVIDTLEDSEKDAIKYTIIKQLKAV